MIRFRDLCGDADPITLRFFGLVGDLMLRKVDNNRDMDHAELTEEAKEKFKILNTEEEALMETLSLQYIEKFAKLDL